MKRSVMLLLVLILATASLMATAAYNVATVTQAAELKVVNTNQALLSLEPNAHWNWGTNMAGTKDKTVIVKDGELFIQFGKGIDRQGTTPVFYGLQPNSIYEWNPLFTLRNKSADTVNVVVSAEGDFAKYITFGTVQQDRDPVWGNQGQPLDIGRVSPESGSGMQNIRSIAVKISVPKNHPVSVDTIMGSIIVKSTAVN